MCGRFAFQATAEDLVRYFRLEVEEAQPCRYNLAPTQPVPVVRVDRQGEWRLSWIRWGLIPFWAKDKRIGARTINARAEGLASKPTFREPFRRRRCLVLASGFYEWRRLDSGKLPYFIAHQEGQPLAFAGLWDRWSDGDGARIDTCSIVTTASNDFVAPIHDRMPVMLGPHGRQLWLDRDAPRDTLEELLQGNAPPPLTAWPVSRRVNAPANDGPELLEPVAAPDD